MWGQDRFPTRGGALFEERRGCGIKRIGIYDDRASERFKNIRDDGSCFVGATKSGSDRDAIRARDAF